MTDGSLPTAAMSRPGYELLAVTEVQERLHVVSAGAPQPLATWVTATDGRELTTAELTSAMTEPRPVRRADGSLILLDATAPDADGRWVIGLRSAAADEEALRRRLAMLEDLLDGAWPQFLAVDLDYRFSYANDAYEKVSERTATALGVEHGEVEGKPAGWMLPEAGAMYRGIVDHVLSEGPMMAELPYPALPGDPPDLPDRIAATSAYPLRDHHGEVIAVGGLTVDVTERVEAMAEARRARAEAERANQAKSEFLSRLGHELRTPLHAVLGFGQLLELEDLGPEGRDLLERINRAGSHLSGLIDDVLEVGRAQTGALQIAVAPLQLAPVIDDVVAVLGPMAAEYQVGPIETIASDRLTVLADERRLRQVLLNLLSNAIKYNEPGGRVTVRSATLVGRARVLITNTGSVIAAEDREHMFLPFERAATGQVSGTGLGLTVSRHLTEAMRGTLRIASSSPAEGTTFALELVQVLDVSEPDRPPSSAAPQSAEWGLGETTILYVDDNAMNVELMTLLLGRTPGTRLVTCADGVSALEQIATVRPDVVLLDLHLPGIPGEDVLAQVVADPELRAIPVIIVTGDADAATATRLLDAGAADHIVKPFRLDRVLESIRSALSLAGRPSAG